MKNFLIKLMLVIAMISSIITAKENSQIKNNNIPKGMKVFKKKMRIGCRSTAIRFSRLHTQQEWKTIKTNGMLRREAKVLCPHLDTSLLSNHDWHHIYRFVRDNASDNPVIIKC